MVPINATETIDHTGDCRWCIGSADTRVITGASVPAEPVHRACDVERLLSCDAATGAMQRVEREGRECGTVDAGRDVHVQVHVLEDRDTLDVVEVHVVEVDATLHRLQLHRVRLVGERPGGLRRAHVGRTACPGVRELRGLRRARAPAAAGGGSGNR